MIKPQPDRLLSIINNFAGKKILVVGDVMLDEYLFGTTTRISPEAPIPIVEVKTTRSVAGGAANAAVNVRALGDETILAGVIGDDRAGKKLLTILRRHRVNTKGIVIDRERPTTVKTRIVSQGQQIVRVDTEERKGIAPRIEETLGRFIARQMKGTDVVLLSDYAKGVLTHSLVQRIITGAKKYKKPLIVDPKTDDFGKYRGATIVTPNIKEAEYALKQSIKDIQMLGTVMGRIIARHHFEAMLITLSEQGMCLTDRNGRFIKLAAPQTKVVDISGAGDTAIASFSLSLAAGGNYEEAMYISSFASGIVIGKYGTETVSRNELLQATQADKFHLLP